MHKKILPFSLWDYPWGKYKNMIVLSLHKQIIAKPQNLILS